MSYWTGPYVQHNIEAIVRLVNLKLVPNLKMAEIGVSDGESSIYYLPAVKAVEGHVYLVDWFKGSIGEVDAQGNPIGKHAYDPSKKDDLKNRLVGRLQEINCLDTCTILDGDSVEMAEQIPDKSLDICFIDADHRYEAVKKDIAAYLPKVKPEGILCGHDCENFHHMGTFSEAEKQIDYESRRHVHPGVLSALEDMFISQSKDLLIMQDFGAHRIPIWLYSPCWKDNTSGRGTAQWARF
jgi:hypothetical protein